ncbi:MAG: ADP-ribosylglycohydrolase family protein, partial [Thermoleophilia bacterium]|nr:ADP-ribosylglycohydrolase family protein [Thermoleophilia bacterium]
MLLGRYRGTLLGVAVGDALGAPVEFLSWDEIRARYGPEGVKGYVLGPYGLGAVTDDTQMTLATARGLLAAGDAVVRGDFEAATRSVYVAYLQWLATPADPRPRRARGFTCLSALRSGALGTVARPLNDSKGCGGVMRVAPVGLALPGRPDEAFALGVRVAAITHGHPGGYIPAGVLAALVSRLVAGEDLHGAVAAEAARRELDPGTRALLQRA